MGDVVAAFLLYKIIRLKASREDANAAFAFWMLCPITIVLSSIWGMFDQLTLAFVLLSFLALSKTVRSSALEGISVLLKAIPVIFLPGLAMAQESTRRRLAYALVAILLTVVLALAPYLVFKNWNLSSLFSTGLSTVAKIYNSVNYWVIIYVWSNYASVPAPVANALTWIGYAWIPAVLAGYVFCFARVGKERMTERYVASSLLFVTLIFYLTRINVNEQYVVYFLGLALIDRYWNGPKRSRLFSGVWVTTFIFLVFNNTYFSRFLTPISSYYIVLNNEITSGLSGNIRFGAMTVCGIVFTVFCALYLRSLYTDISAYRRGYMPTAPESSRLPSS